MSDPTRLFEYVKRVASSRIAGMVPDQVDVEMRLVMADFLTRSQVWKREIEVPLVAGTRDYTLDIEDYETATELQEAVYSESPLTLGAVHRTYTDTGAPRMAGLLTDRLLRVFPIPTSSESGEILRVVVVLSLLPDIEVVAPDEIRPYINTLMSGFLGRAYNMVGRGWANPLLAVQETNQFEGDCDRIRKMNDQGRGRSRGQTRVSFPPI